MEYYGLAILLLVGTIVVLGGLAHIGTWLLDRDGFDGDYERFMAGTRERGLSYGEAMDEWRVREVFAAFREEATALATIDFDNWRKAIETAQQHAFDTLARERRPELLQMLGGMLKGCTYGDIFYDPIRGRIDRQRPADPARPTQHQRAALRIVK